MSLLTCWPNISITPRTIYTTCWSLALVKQTLSVMVKVMVTIPILFVSCCDMICYATLRRVTLRCVASYAPYLVTSSFVMACNFTPTAVSRGVPNIISITLCFDCSPGPSCTTFSHTCFEVGVLEPLLNHHFINHNLLSLSLYVHTYMCIYIYICIYICTYIMCIYIYIYILCVCVSLSLSLYIYIYIV